MNVGITNAFMGVIYSSLGSLTFWDSDLKVYPFDGTVGEFPISLKSVWSGVSPGFATESNFSFVASDMIILAMFFLLGWVNRDYLYHPQYDYLVSYSLLGRKSSPSFSTISSSEKNTLPMLFGSTMRDAQSEMSTPLLSRHSIIMQMS